MKEAKLGDSMFMAYDVRGIYPKQLDESTAEALGCSFGEYIGRGKSIAICRDVRLSSDSLTQSFLKGISSSRPKMIDIGVAPTPVIYFALKHYGIDGGVNITASHNPKEWNGFKFYSRDAEAIGMENGLAIIRDTSRRNSSCESLEMKIEDRHKKTMSDYEKFLLGKIKLSKGLRIGLDPGNGSYSGLAKRVFEDAGAKVLAINDKPDGSFPGRSPEPNDGSLGELKKLVIEEGLDMGLALDPDGDRGIFVDGKGRVLRGDLALAIFVKNFLKKGETVIFDVSSTDLIREEALRKKAIPIMIRVGRSFVLAAMAHHKAAMGAEISGHTYFADVYGGDDALFAGLKMAELISMKGMPLSELIDELPHYENAVLELPIENAIKFRVIDAITQKLSKTNEVITIDGVKVIKKEGWFVLRASNTSPKIRLVVEAKEKKELNKIVEYAKKQLEEAEKVFQR